MSQPDRPHYWRELNFFGAFKACGFEPEAIFDIGSSHAGWSWRLSSLFPGAAFHLFEPLFDHKPNYHKDWIRDFLESPNVRVHSIALGDNDGWTSLGSDDSGYSASTLVSEPSKHFPEVFKVPIRRLDSYVKELGLPKVQLLKVDVQGAELAVLDGAGSLLEDVRLIQIETWLRRSYDGKTPLLHEITEYLSDRGFSLIDFGGVYYTDLHEMLAVDAFFARVDLLNEIHGKLPNRPLIEDLDSRPLP
jgi:FkbM family methyltransferase